MYQILLPVQRRGYYLYSHSLINMISPPSIQHAFLLLWEIHIPPLSTSQYQSVDNRYSLVPVDQISNVLGYEEPQILPCLHLL